MRLEVIVKGLESPWDHDCLLSSFCFVLFFNSVAWSYGGSWEGWSGAHAVIWDIKMYLTAAFPPSSLSHKHRGWLAGSKFHCLWSYLGRQALAILEIKTFLWPDRQSYSGPIKYLKLSFSHWTLIINMIHDCLLGEKKHLWGDLADRWPTSLSCFLTLS